MKKLFTLFIFTLFALLSIGATSSSTSSISVDWDSLSNQVSTFSSSSSESIGTSDAVAEAMGINGNFSLDDYTLQAINENGLSSITSLSQSDISNLQNIASLNGMENLSFLNSLNQSNLSIMSLSSLGDVSGFNFNETSLSTYSSAFSLSSAMGVQGSIKGSLQNIIALESQTTQQNSGELIKLSTLIILYRKEILYLTELAFQEQKVNEILAE